MYGIGAKLMTASLRLMKEEVEDTTGLRVHKACTFKTSVQHGARMSYNGCVSADFGVWSTQSLDTDMAVKCFDGGNLIELPPRTGQLC